MTNSISAIKTRNEQETMKRRKTVNSAFIAVCVILSLAGIVCIVMSIIFARRPDGGADMARMVAESSTGIIQPITARAPTGMYILGGIFMLAAGLISVKLAKDGYNYPGLNILGFLTFLPWFVIIVQIIGRGGMYVALLDFRVFLTGTIASAMYFVSAIFRNREMPKAPEPDRAENGLLSPSYIQATQGTETAREASREDHIERVIEKNSLTGIFKRRKLWTNLVGILIVLLLIAGILYFVLAVYPVLQPR